MSNVVAAAAFARGIFNLTRTGIAGSTGKRSWGRGQRDANAAPKREAYAGNHDPGQGGGAPSS